MSPLQAEADMRQKAELIQQIKALESVPIIRTKFVDTTETGGQGLLAEMSLAEVWWSLSTCIYCTCASYKVNRLHVCALAVCTPMYL